MAVLLNRSVLRPVGRGRSRAWGLGRGGEDGASDVRIIDIRGADERARQPTGGKGPRITSGGPYSSRRSGQTCVHPVLSALARARRGSARRRKRARIQRARRRRKTKNERKKKEKGERDLTMGEKSTRFLDLVSLPRNRIKKPSLV